MCKHIRFRCSAGYPRTILVGTPQAMQIMLSTPLADPAMCTPARVCVKIQQLLLTSPGSTLVQMASVMQPRLGLTSEERVAVLPLVPLRLGLPMVHELVRSMAIGWMPDCWLADAEAQIEMPCDKVRAMYGQRVSASCGDLYAHLGKCTTNHGTVLHRVS